MNHKTIRNLHFVNVWRVPKNEFLSSEILNFWQLNTNLRLAELQKRVSQVVVVIREEHGKIVGLSTAFYSPFKKIRAYVYGYRCLIDKEFRAAGMESKLAVVTKEILEKDLDSFRENIPVGMLAVVQHKELKEQVNWAVWLGSGFTFIGKNKQGDDLRISYFGNAQV